MKVIKYLLCVLIGLCWLGMVAGINYMLYCVYPSVIGIFVGCALTGVLASFTYVVLSESGGMK